MKNEMESEMMQGCRVLGRGLYIAGGNSLRRYVTTPITQNQDNQVGNNTNTETETGAM